MVLVQCWFLRFVIVAMCGFGAMLVLALCLDKQWHLFALVVLSGQAAHLPWWLFHARCGFGAMLALALCNNSTSLLAGYRWYCICGGTLGDNSC